MKKFLIWINLVLVLSLATPIGYGFAQTEQPKGPVYVVQKGDTLYSIALRFGVSMKDLERANGITNPNQLAVGFRLVIPGLEGIQGELVTETVPTGESLLSLSRRYRVSPEALIRLNRLTTPAELYAGAFLVVPKQGEAELPTRRVMLSPGQSLLELAVSAGVNPWSLATRNRLTGLYSGLPGDGLLAPTSSGSAGPAEGPGALPAVVTSVELNPLLLLQGKTTVIKLSVNQKISLKGSLGGHELHFFPDNADSYVALQGVHAMAEPGLYPLVLNGALVDGTIFAFSQMVNLQGVNYPFDRPLTVPPETVDPAVTKPEDTQWTALMIPATSERYWNGIFKFPSPLPLDYCLKTGNCWPSRFGNRRSYNGSAYNFFHTGLDIVGKIGAEIYAPSPGVVVFAGPLSVRGNATVIDHGWGVYTGYLHQSEIFVKPGDQVKTGQVIGLVGKTGRVEGPHLHWEIWVGGVQVDPLDWLQQAFP